MHLSVILNTISVTFLMNPVTALWEGRVRRAPGEGA